MCVRAYAQRETKDVCANASDENKILRIHHRTWNLANTNQCERKDREQKNWVIITSTHEPYKYSKAKIFSHYDAASGSIGSHLSMRFSITFYSFILSCLHWYLSMRNIVKGKWISLDLPPRLLNWIDKCCVQFLVRWCKIQMKIEPLHTKNQSVFTIVQF